MSLPTWFFPPVHAEPEVVAAADRGAHGNSRLTSATGIVLLAILLVEGVTLLSVRQMITLHIFVGVMVIPPALLKTASTLYRFAGYYTGRPAYRKAGPPPLLLRVLGPLLVVATLALLGSGIVLIFVGDHRDDGWLTAHQACFIVWVVLFGVHVLGHIWEAAKISRNELRRALSGPAARARRWRFVLLVASLALGVAAAIILLPHASSWTTDIGKFPGRFGPPPGFG